MKRQLLAFLILQCFVVSLSEAQLLYDKKFTRTPSVAYAKRALQGFNMKVWISNQMTLGLQAWDAQSYPEIPVPPGIGLEYPVGSGIEHLFGAGPWMGGIINGVRRVSEGYNGDSGEKFFLPNRYHPLRERIWFTSTLNTDEPNRRYYDDDNDGKTDEDDLDGVDNDGDWVIEFDDVGADGIPDSLEDGCKGPYSPTNLDPAFDNYEPAKIDYCHPEALGNFRSKNDRDLYTEKNRLQDHGEPHVDEDYGAVSESDYYCSATDTITQGSHFPMGIKVIQKSYAWSSDFTDAILPFDYTFVNIGEYFIEDVYLAFFADVDIGPTSNATDQFQFNYACYSESLRTAYGHNPIDRGSTPLGFTLLNTSRRLDSLRYFFQWIDFRNNFGPGTEDSSIYIWMSGGIPFLDDIMPCQPPTSPSDTRFVFSFGPFEQFIPGDSIKFSIALVSGYGVDIGPNNMKENAAKAMALSQRDLNYPVTPPSPQLKITTEKHRTILEWGSSVGTPDPLELFDRRNVFLESLPDTHWRVRDNPDPSKRGGRIFEGFKVWRSTSPTFDSTSFSLLAQYDVDDDLNFGYQTGLKFSYIDSTVRTGNEYWYAVTSYSIPTIGSFIVPLDGGEVKNINYELEATESSLGENAEHVRLNFGPSQVRGEVMVVPNPYRGDVSYTDADGFEGPGRLWNYSQRAVKFINLPERATIRIFSVAGDVITTILHDDRDGTSVVGEELWRLFSKDGRPITGGIYVFSVESELGTQIGKFVILK